MATKQDQIRFIKTVCPAACSLYVKSDGIHPVFVTAQAALETGWTVKDFGNNIFGITKGNGWTGETQLAATREEFSSPNKKFYPPEEIISIKPMANGKYEYRVRREFRKYDSLEDCLDDHLSVLKRPGYADAWAYRNDPKEFARRISDSAGAKYATDSSYSATMCAVIDTITNRIKEIKNEVPRSAALHDIFFLL
jgi:flagellar protein FlgJ